MGQFIDTQTSQILLTFSAASPIVLRSAVGQASYAVKKLQIPKEEGMSPSWSLHQTFPMSPWPESAHSAHA